MQLTLKEKWRLKGRRKKKTKLRARAQNFQTSGFLLLHLNPKIWCVKSSAWDVNYLSPFGSIFSPATAAASLHAVDRKGEISTFE